MQFRSIVLSGIVATSILCAANPQQALGQAVTTAFTYQGVLKNSGAPLNGTVDLRFSLWTAAVGGSQIGSSLSVNAASLTDGLLTTTLDFGVSAFAGSQRFLQIEVDVTPGGGVGPFVTLNPRQPLTAVPYAMFALAGSGQWTPDGSNLNYTQGNVSVGTTTQNGKVTIYPNAGGGGTQTGLYVRNTDSVNQYSVANFISDSSAGIGVQASVGSGNGATGRAVAATSGATNGMGVYAVNTSTTGAAYGVYGQSNSSTGRGVYGLANASSGLNYGVYGDTNSSGGFAGFFSGRVYVSTYLGIGGAQAPIWPIQTQSVAGVGIDALVTGTTADAIVGRVNNASGTTTGVRGESSSVSGKGVWGRAFADTGTTYGGYFEADSTTGRAVRAIASGTTGSPIAVYGTCSSAAGWGLYMSAGQNYFSGNVGIGTTSPDVKLHIVGGADTSPTGGGYIVTGAVTSTNISMDSNEIMARNNGAVSTLHLNADGGDVQINQSGSGRLITRVLQINGGSDLSEQFDVSNAEVEPQPGMVVVIDPANPGRLMPATTAYDKKVAGIISGAGGVASGMLMGQTGTIADGAHAIALTGRVYCLVDASDEAIEPGDLLTTSDTLGHAMKAVDSDRSHGTVIGKAMTNLPRGEKGLVLVLVNLQ